MHCRSSLIMLVTVLVLASNVLAARHRTKTSVGTRVKSESAAVGWSLLSTFGPCALGIGLMAGGNSDSDEWSTRQDMGAVIFSAGVIIGPSAGYFYAQRPGRGVAGLGIRAAVAGGTAIVAGSVGSQGSFDSGLGAGLVALGGATLCFSLAVFDITRVDNATRSYNQSLAGQRTLDIVPAYFAGQHAFGTAVVLRF